MVTKDKPIVFISYTSADEELAMRIRRDLRERRIRAKTSRDFVLPGDVIEAKIKEGIAEADFFVVVISRSTGESVWLQKEIEFARSKQKMVIPVLAEETELPDQLRGIQFCDITASYPDGIERLTHSLKMKRKARQQLIGD